MAQLRGVSPALNESDITRERLALEEAIRKVEAEAARRSRMPDAAEPAKPDARPAEPPALEFQPGCRAPTFRAPTRRAATVARRRAAR